jgi:WD40 repeat protein
MTNGQPRSDPGVHIKKGDMGDGALLAVAVGDVGGAGAIEVLDAGSGRDRLSLAGHRQRVWKLAFNLDGTRLVSLASFPMHPAEVKLWDLAGSREMLTLKTTGVDLTGSNGLGNSGFAFSPDGHRLSYLPGGSRREAEVPVWDATPMPEESTSGPVREAIADAVADDGDLEVKIGA